MDILTSTVAEGVLRPAIGGGLVYRKSARGVVKLAAVDGGQLSPLERQVLIMVDGRRTLAQLAELFGSDKLRLLSLLSDLEAKGLLKRVDPRVDAGLAAATTQVGTSLPDVLPSNATHANAAARAPAWLRDPAPGHDRWPKRFPPPAIIPKPKLPASRARGLPLDEHPLAWFALGVLLTIVCTTWMSNHFLAESRQKWWSHYPQAQWTDPYGRPAIPDAIGGGRSDRPSPIRMAPLPAKAPVAPAVRVASAVNRPASVAPHIAPHGSATTKHEARATPAAPSPAATVAERSAESVASPPPTPEAALSTREPEVGTAPPGEPSSNSFALRPLRQDPPRIPEKVVHNGVVEGHVQVRLWITPEGKVDQVDVLGASPPGVLDDEVRRVLSLWTFEPPGHPMDEVVQLTLAP